MICRLVKDGVDNPKFLFKNGNHVIFIKKMIFRRLS